MIKIPLAGKYSSLSALIDEDDEEAVRKYSWVRAERSGIVYAQRRWVADGKQRSQYLHTYLTGFALVDHVNHDGLDNRRANLRESDRRGNIRNCRKRSSAKGVPCTSQYKGVAARRKKWVAGITVLGKHLYLGIFDNEEDAARVYDRAARQHFGEFACLNFPEG